jgi:type III pantothenate kinase
MLLAIDVGNTNIVFGAFDGAKLIHSWRLLTLRADSRRTGLLVTGPFAHAKMPLNKITAVVMDRWCPC